MGYDLNEQAGEDSQDISKINAAGLINLRIQDSWNACTRHYNNGDYDTLRDELAALWVEFYADATDKQIEKLTALDKEISLTLKKRALNRKVRRLWFSYNTLYKKAVYSKWLFLKTLEKSQGVGKAYADPGADEWE